MTVFILLGSPLTFSRAHLLNELDHAHALPLVEADGTAQGVELSRQPQRGQSLHVPVEATPPSARRRIAKRLPGAARGVQRVQSDAAGRRRKIRDVSECVSECECTGRCECV